MKEYLINRNDTLAFPVPNMNTGEKQAGIQLPVDLRDYFAAKAMQGMISEPSIQGTMNEFAHRAYAIADAMMAARSAT